MISIIALSLSVVLLSILVCVLCISNVKLWIELKSMSKSTHQIMMPSNMADALFEKQDDQTKETLDKAFEDYKGIN